jgi:hypothetical protein
VLTVRTWGDVLMSQAIPAAAPYGCLLRDAVKYGLLLVAAFPEMPPREHSH